MKILLVDDARAVSAMMAARLNAFGHEVCLAENGLIALDKFREFSPDLVLMDIEMPVMNGFEATSRIRALEATQMWAVDADHFPDRFRQYRESGDCH